jgi:hypothetical protein
MARKATKRKPTQSKKPRSRPRRKGQQVGLNVKFVDRGRKALVEVYSQDGQLLFTDRADLSEAKERQRLARLLAARLQGDTAELELQLEQAHVQAHQQRAAEQAAAAEVSSPPIPPVPPESCYVIDNGRICHQRYTREGGEVLVPLCNFTAVVTEAVRVDDGSGEVQHYFTIAGELAGGGTLPPAVVRASDFAPMNWPLSAWGLRAIVGAGQGVKDHLRIAIQELSKAATVRTTYKHVGWRKENEQWVYLHGAGAIGAEGLVGRFSVELDGPLAGFRLPPPPEGDELARSVRASLALRSVSDRLMSALLGAVYRAVLGGTDCSLHLVGHTGYGKSELCALAQQHFGAGLDRLHLPGNWLSTGNALESLAFLAKDALVVVDDFKPGGSKSDIDRLHALADRVLRAQGNSSGRGRCRPDGSLRPPRPPRGMILSSGEDIPRGESLRARQLVVHVVRGEVPISALTPYQAAGAQGDYAQAMSAYLRWLAPRYEEIQGRLARERATLRDRAVALNGHARTPGIVADLALGWKYFLDFALEMGAITPSEREQTAKDVWQALQASAGQQEAEIAAQDPANRFLEFLVSSVASGRAHVASREGFEPEQALAWGWRLESVGAGDNAETRWRPQGKQIGWLDGEDLYLDPEASYAEVQRLADEHGDRIPLSPRQLHKRLKERSLLVSTETGKNTTRRALQGRERSVLHLRADCLIPQKPGESGEQGARSENPDNNPPNPSPYLVNGHLKQGEAIGDFSQKTPEWPPIPPIPPVSGRGRSRSGPNSEQSACSPPSPPRGAKLMFQDKNGRPCPAAKAACWTWEGATAWYRVNDHAVPSTEIAADVSGL